MLRDRDAEPQLLTWLSAFTVRDLCEKRGRVAITLPGRLFSAGLAMRLHQRDKTVPVENRSARPQMGPQPIFFELYLPPAAYAVAIHRRYSSCDPRASHS